MGGRICSAPQPECRPYRIRSDEPMKIKRVGGNESLIGTEGWGAGGCMLEEADGSSINFSWTTSRTKSTDTPPYIGELGPSVNLSWRKEVETVEFERIETRSLSGSSVNVSWNLSQRDMDEGLEFSKITTKSNTNDSLNFSQLN